ncbi:uncharacterized zinc finger CCHC domain-containing protein At4g19190 [Mangifera indica]|uniref:uncharacterized zinc finger CCHC domain-containing protein At4g19190 n=1 Tax=Mangifera indica TaxID=29780 RepID=UPI001CF9F078|nr:uncharacterized zinc finger CCHC domain-containing protein At4g19190 [Mangifera indica]
MEGEEFEGGIGKRLKKFTESGEVDYKTKSGTAWSHSYLNQKPWHPLSYPNQRRKWIAEQIHSNKQRRAEEVAREYGQEQEFFRQTALISKKDKDKMETMQAVSFMYVRPPGYNAESAKAAEIEDEKRRQGQVSTSQDSPAPAMHSESLPVAEEKKKSRPKDVFGRPLPTEEEFEVLKNAPRLETGAPARVKPFGVEVRNVKCLRCGNYGHQSGDRECPLKDAIMPNEESRLKRDDPLTAILARTDPAEPLKWELKRQPGNFSPPRGGFKPDDPNQQIVAEDIFDEYGGFLGGGDVPELLTNLSIKPRKKSRKKSKHKRQSSPSSRNLRVPDEDGSSSPSDSEDKRSKKRKKHKKKKKQSYSRSISSEDSEFDRHPRKSRHRHSYSSEDSGSEGFNKGRRNRQRNPYSSKDDSVEHHMKNESGHKHSSHFENVESDRRYRSKKSWQKHPSSSENDADQLHTSENYRNMHSCSSEDSDSGRHQRNGKSRQKHSYTPIDDSDRRHRSKKSRQKYSYSRSFEDFDSNGHNRSKVHRHR